jgi:hypothetical protein
MVSRGANAQLDRFQGQLPTTHTPTLAAACTHQGGAGAVGDALTAGARAPRFSPDGSVCSPHPDPPTRSPVYEREWHPGR